MPMYMDIHNVDGATADAIASAHDADVSIQHKHDAHCVKYWWNEGSGKLFCLFEAPNAEAANAVHREAHGLLAENIIEVDPALAEGFLGGGGVNAAGAATVRLAGRESEILQRMLLPCAIYLALGGTVLSGLLWSGFLA